MAQRKDVVGRSVMKRPYHETVIRPNSSLFCFLCCFDLAPLLRLSGGLRWLSSSVYFNRNFSTALRRFGDRHIDGQNAVFEGCFCLVDLRLIRNRDCAGERAVAALRP